MAKEIETSSNSKSTDDYIKCIDKICEDYRYDVAKLRTKYMKKFYKVLNKTT